ncbi:MAG: thioredoxin domain-containing protein [Gemmatimonadetes bacterium]|nr:thioredoxin domain-containing protein [Gemmatimonadota bacterium]
MPNRLEGEQSLYLRQHAGNPVDWYPWGPAALDRARALDRPMLVSIGYSACHWCHVMERESFEDPETARIMNDGFVCVKVDREERPDVDGIYMRAVQALTGHGGWPLTVFLTPDARPYYGGTYFPPEPRHGMPSFRQVLSATRAAWDERRSEVTEAAERIRDLLRRSTLGPDGELARASGQPLDPSFAASAAEELLRRFDPVFGGFGRAPKFPQPVVLEFLLEHFAYTGRTPALEAVLHTLRKMGRGGIRDHLGGGFHRYSVDQRWLAPHFEKMLYDNALLAGAYLRGYQLTGDEELLGVCREVLDDVLDDFRSPEGAFFAARDADSEGEEGLFYLWTADQVDEELGHEAGRLLRRCYDVSKEGNFTEGNSKGRNILHLPHDLDAVARDEGITRPELERALAAGRKRLREIRSHRVAPARDEKVLAAWNALALRALAEAGAALDEPRYVAAAREGAAWLLEALAPDGRCLHQVPAVSGGVVPGEAAPGSAPGSAKGARILAFLDDVAGLGNALLSLHEATLEPQWLLKAVELDLEVDARFLDPETGLLHDTPADGEPLVVRPREVMDSPVPSGASLAAELKLRLGRLLGDGKRLEDAREIVDREVNGMRQMPSGFGRLLTVAQRLAHPPIEVAIVGDREDPRTQALLHEVHRVFLPGSVVTGMESGMEGGGTPPVATPLLEGRVLEGRATSRGRPTAFVCTGFVCRAPSTDPEALRGELAELARAQA